MKTKLLRLLTLLVVVAGIALAIAYRDYFDAAALERWVADAGAAGPVLFMLIYAIGTVFFLPGSVLTLAGGAMFGPVLGTLYNLTGATLGATLAFLVARYLAAGWVERKTGGRLKQLKQGVEGEGCHFSAFVRPVPLFPFNLLNHGLGLTRIELSHYVIASCLCMFRLRRARGRGRRRGGDSEGLAGVPAEVSRDASVAGTDSWVAID